MVACLLTAHLTKIYLVDPLDKSMVDRKYVLYAVSFRAPDPPPSEGSVLESDVRS